MPIVLSRSETWVGPRLRLATTTVISNARPHYFVILLYRVANSIFKSFAVVGEGESESHGLVACRQLHPSYSCWTDFTLVGGMPTNLGKVNGPDSSLKVGPVSSISLDLVSPIPAGMAKGGLFVDKKVVR